MDLKTKPRLTSHQSRLLRDYKKILYITGLNPDLILERGAQEPDAIVPVLKLMIDQVVRSEIILEYAFIDSELNFLLTKHFFGSGKRLVKARSTRRFKTFQQILQNLYLLRKLEIVRRFKTIPKHIVSKIAAINDLRNGIAHAFFLSDLKKPKRTYKGINVFTPKGLETYSEDSREIRYFFQPWLKRILEEEAN